MADALRLLRPTAGEFTADMMPSFRRGPPGAAGGDRPGFGDRGVLHSIHYYNSSPLSNLTYIYFPRWQTRALLDQMSHSQQHLPTQPT